MTDTTFQEEAAILVKTFMAGKAERSPDAAAEYTSIFLDDYSRALNDDDTTPEQFLNAYTYREQAKRAGAKEADLDFEGYLKRIEWARKYDQLIALQPKEN